ncbi:hypothetical protein [Streptosporangium vulgare]|uniref:Uncharacterized protein n=1 Tax=Streptosporangium vulgare TaxID=46190 RepID=A0ABV5TA01_9ACTN
MAHNVMARDVTARDVTATSSIIGRREARESCPPDIPPTPVLTRCGRRPDNSVEVHRGRPE